jgi:hypothetical protein
MPPHTCAVSQEESAVTVYEHLESLAGKPVVDWDPAAGIQDSEGTIYRVSLDYDDAEKGVHWADHFAQLLDDPASARLTGLVVGPWDYYSTDTPTSAHIVAALVAARDRLPNLTVLFVGDIISEEAEISWIQQSDVTPLLEAYPALEHFQVRGGTGLVLAATRHDRLRALVIESGGLDAQVGSGVLRSELPALEHLEVWLGTERYGANTTVADLEPLVAGTLFPSLRYLGLRDSEIANEIAAAIAQAPILERIRVLDLSLGTLDDSGAAALLASPAIRNLEKLDLHHHYCSEAMMAQLETLGIEVDTSDRQEPDVWDGEEHRYVAVSE